MKIALIAPLWHAVPPDGYGGTERVIATLADGYVARGHEVTLFAAEGSRTRARLSAHCRPLVGREPLEALSKVEEAIMLDRLRRVAGQFDVLHFNTEFFHYALLAEHGARMVTTLHWRVDEADRQTLFRHFADARVICVSDAQRQMLPKGMTRTHRIHHGLPTDMLPAGDGAGGYLAFMGRISPQKRPDWAIEVARRTGLPLRIAGEVDFPNRRYLEEVILPAAGDGVELVGTVRDAEKAAFLGGATALLFPLDWPEPFGMVMIEAMACATPVIAWARGSAAELVDDGETGFAVDDIDGAVAAVGRARDVDRVRVRAAFERRFSAERMIDEHLALYAAMSG